MLLDAHRFIVAAVLGALVLTAPLGYAIDPRHELVAGTWVLAPEDARFEVLGVVSSYNVEGEVTIVIFETPRCESPIFAARGVWGIAGDQLIVVLTESSDSSVFPVGHRRKESIVQIDIERMVVRSEVSGNLVHRARGERCLSTT